MAYATAAQLLERYDARVLGEYAGDSGAVIAPGSLPANTRVIAALNDASAMIDAALMKSRKYTSANITAAGYLPIRMCCDLAAGLILEARMLPQEEVGQLVPRYKEARDWCDRLSVGTEVLPIEGNLDAGLPNGTITPNTPNSTYNKLFGYWGVTNGYLYND